MPRPTVRAQRLGAVMVHQFMHGTKTATDALAARRRLGSMRKLIAARDAGRRAR